MTQELVSFEISMDELRKAYAAASGKPSVQSALKSKFDIVVRQKDIYLFGTLGKRAAALNALSTLLEEAISIMKAHVANFPLTGLNSILTGFGAEDGKDINESIHGSGVDISSEISNSHADNIVIASGDIVEIDINPSDFDALCRVAQSEVGHFGKYGKRQLAGGLSAVVDTIINRTAHMGYANTISEVIDQPYQFSAINSLGTWRKLPEAKTTNANIILEHLQSRAAGISCSIKGATHFLNPYLSSANALATWGNFVVMNAVAIFGDDSKKDVHYHGFAPNTSLPKPYTLKFGGQESGFTGSGVASSQSGGEPKMASQILEICDLEWQYFSKGTRKESDDPEYNRVGDYWASIGLPYNGRTKILNKATGKTSNPAWSAAFISYVVKNAGANEGFKYAQAHCHYVQDFIDGRPNAIYEAMHPDSYAPQAGDIVHFGRSTAKQFDFSEARSSYTADSFYPSHSDIVMRVDSAEGEIFTVGGNVNNSVSQKQFAINSDGTLKHRKESGNSYPWISVLRLIK